MGVCRQLSGPEAGPRHSVQSPPELVFRPLEGCWNLGSTTASAPVLRRRQGWRLSGASDHPALASVPLASQGSILRLFPVPCTPVFE